MPLAAFDELNRKRGDAGERLFPNPRNTAAGSLRQKDASVTASRDLAFYAYQLGVQDGGPIFTTHHDTLAWMRDVGFPVNEHIEELDDMRRGVRVLRAHAREPALARLRDRRRGGEDRRPRATHRVGLHESRTTMGDRVQVPARGEDDRSSVTSW